MSEETKVFNLPDNNGSNLGEMMALMNGGCGGVNGMWNNPIWALVFLSVLGNGGFGFGANRGAGMNANTDFVSSQLGQAISGNANAISNLATQLNCTESQIQSTLTTMMGAINNVSNNMNMSTQGVINAINSGNQSLASQLASCCCELRQQVTTQGYENQINTMNQTAALGNKVDCAANTIGSQIANQTTFLADKFCDLEKRELQNKIDALRERNTQLSSQIDNANQTAQISAYVNSSIAPIAAAVSNLANVVNEIKCAIPNTVTVPANNGVLLPPCAAAQLGYYGNLASNNGSLWN